MAKRYEDLTAGERALLDEAFKEYKSDLAYINRQREDLNRQEFHSETVFYNLCDRILGPDFSYKDYREHFFTTED